jgi:hypothetical protein
MKIYLSSIDLKKEVGIVMLITARGELLDFKKPLRSNVLTGCRVIFQNNEDAEQVIEASSAKQKRIESWD